MKKFIIFFLTAFLILGFSLTNAENLAHKAPAVDAFTLQIAPESHTYSFVSDTTLKFTVSVTSGSVTSAATIKWYVNGAQSGSDKPFTTGKNFKPNFQVAGEYTVKATVVDGSETVNTPEVNVTILENYVVTVHGPSTACLGENVTLTADLGNSELNNLTTFTYQWKKDGNYIPGANQATYQFVAAEDNSGDYVVEVSHPGCALSVSHPHRLDVLPNATVDVDSVWYICNGIATITAAAYPETSGTPYRWMWVSVDNNDTTYTNAPSFTTSTTGTYYVKPMYHLTGCNNADSAQFVVREIEGLYTFKFLNDLIYTCDGDQVEFSLDMTGDEFPNLIYTWYENGVIIDGANTHFLRTSPLVTGADTTLYRYVVVVANAENCVLGTDTMDVVVRPQPQIQLFGDHDVCANGTQNISITAFIDGVTGNPAFFDHIIWYQNGAIKNNINADKTNFTLTLNVGDNFEPYTFQAAYYDPATGCYAMSEEFVVTIHDMPVVNITSTFDTVCVGGEITLTANLDDYNEDQYVFQWYKNSKANENMIPGATLPVYTTTMDAVAVDSFFVQVLQRNTTCETFARKDIVTVADPVITLEADLYAICDGGQINLTTTVEGGSGEISYVWYRNGELIEGADLSYLTESPLAVDGDSTIYTYVVMAISERGCNSDFDTVSVVVRRNHFIEIMGDHDVCVADNNIDLDAFIDGVTGNPAHFDYITWYQNGAIIENPSANKTNLVKDLSVGNDFEPYIFQVSYNDPVTGCNAMSEQFVVTVHDLPVVNITASEETICVGGEVTLTANLNDYNEEQYVYQWYKNGKQPENLIPGATLPTYTTTLDVVAVDSFFVQVYQRNTSCVSFARKDINVVADPVINNITLDVYEICDGRQVIITANATIPAGVGEPVYTWYRNGDLIEGVTAASFTESPLAVDGDATPYVYSAFVTNPASGCQSEIVAADELVVYANPTVTISGDPIVCDLDENNVTLTANVIGELPIVYQWYENDTPISGETNQVLDLTKPYREYPYSFSVEVTNEVGCTTFSEPFLVYVNDSIVVNVTASEYDICVGGEVTVTAHLNDWNADQVIYQWSKDGEIIPGATDLTYTTTLDEIRAHEFSFRATQLTSSCTAVGTTTVNAVADPVIDTILVSEYAICEGDQVTVTAHITSEFGVGTFTWFRNGILLEGITGPSFVDVPAATDFDTTRYVYSAYMTNTPSGCQSLVKEAAVVDVFDAPTVTISGDPIICANDPDNITLHANATGDELALNYQWYENDTILTGETSEVLTLTRDYREYPYSFSVMVSNTLGCYDVSEPFLVYVNDSIVVNVTVDESIICEGGDVTMTAHLNDWNADQLVYQWSDANGIIPGATDLNYTTVINNDGTHTFYFTATQLTSSCTATGSVNVEVVNDPVINDITLDVYEICDGRQVTITADATIPAGVGEPVYTWYRNGELIEGVTAASFTESPLAVDGDATPYVYSAFVTNPASGCQSEIVAADELVVYANPTVTISGDPIVCDLDENNVTLTANVIGELPIVYQWYENDTPISGETNQVLDLTKPYREYPYSFSVQVTNEVGCTTFSEPFLVYVNDSIVVNVTATENTICVGGEVTMTAHLNDWNADQIVYQWYKDDVLIPGATDLTYTTTLNEVNAYEFSFRATQLTSSCTAVGSTVINVVVDPVIESITVSEYALCSGGEITVTAHPASVTGTATYTWYRNGELIEGVTAASFTESPLAVDADVTTYVYSAVLTTDVSGCESSIVASNEVTVYGNPRVSIAGDANICETDSVYLAAYVDHISDEVGILSYTWYVDGQHRDNLGYDINNPNSQFYSEYWPARYEPYRVTVEVTRENGCTTMSEPFLQYVHALPVVNITAPESEICVGGELMLTANLNDYTTEHMTYQWYTVSENSYTVPSGPDTDTTYTEIIYTNIPGATSQTLLVDPTETTVYGVKVFQTHSECYDTDEFTVTVLTLPVVDDITFSATAVCDGGQVVISAVEANPTNLGTPVYTWYRNGELIEGVTAASFTESPLTVDGDITSYVYSVSLSYDLSGCQSPVFASEPLMVYPNPSVRIEGDPIVCQDSTVILVANVNDAIEGVTFTYQWRRFNQDIPGATSNVLTTTEEFTFGNPIEYTVVVNAQFDEFIGCQTISEPYYVVIGANPRVELTANDTVVCPGGEVELTANIANSYIDNLEVNWYVNGEYITGAHSLTYVATITETSVFTATIASNECVAETEPITITVAELPVIASVTAYNQDGVTDVCDGGEVEITAYMFDENGNSYVDSSMQYIWTRNGFTLENVTGPWFRESLMSVDQDTTHFTYSVVAVSPVTGCYSIPSESNTVTVYRNPIVVINGSHNVCENVSNNDPNVNLSVVIDGVFGYDPNTTIRWYKNGTLYQSIDPYGLSFSELLGVTNQEVVYQVEVIRPNGCSAWSEPFSVEVHPAPVLNITAEQSFVCQGGELTLVGNLNDYNEDDYVYQWYYTSTNVNAYDLIPGATQRTFDVPVTLQAGEYNFMLEVYQRILDGSVLGYGPSCSTTDTININVLPTPTVDSIVVAGTGNDNSICSGGQVEVTAYVSGLPGIPSYQWYRNGILIEGANSATIIDNPVANDDDITTYLYSVVVTSQFSGCQTTNDVTSEPVIVYPNPRVAISGDANICEGDSVFLIAYVDNTSDNVGDLTYTWYESGQERDNMTFNIGNQAGSQFYSEYWYPRHEPYVFTVEVSRGNGCTSISEPFNVYVHERPEVDVTATETTVCEGGEVTLTANLLDNTTEHITYQWYTIENVERQVEREPGVFTTVVDVITTNIEGATAATYTTTVDATTQFGVTVYQTHSACTNTDVITINTVPAPVVTGIAVAGVNEGNEICDGGQITLTASIEGGVQGGEVYTWYRNGVVIPNANTATIVESPVTVDGDVTTYIYNVTVAQTASGCESALTSATEVTVVVNPNPTVTVAVEGNTTICDGGSVTLNANVYPVLPTTTYQWFLDNTPIAGATSASYTVENAAARETAYQYHVVVTQLSGCSVVSEIVPVTVVNDPVVNVTVDNAAVCVGGNATFTATVAGGVDNVNGLNGYTFAWYNTMSPDAAIGTASTLTVNATEVGTTSYWVVVTSPYGCETIAYYYDFEVVADPSVTVVIANGYPAQVCEGGSTMLTANVVGGLGTISYQWYKDGNLLPGETNQTIHTDPLYLNAASTYTVNVVMSGVGCGATNSFVAGGSVQNGGIVVDAPEVVISGNANTCPGGTVTLTANLTGGIAGDVYQYQWYQNGQPVGTNSDVYTTSPLLLGNSYNYRVEVISTISGCTAISNDVPANVYPEPTVAISGPNPDGISTICENGTITLNAYVTGGVPGETYTYTWTYRQGATTGQFVTTTSSFEVPATLVANADPNSPYYFSVSVMSDNYHCDAASSADQSYIINIISAPEATITVTNPVACEGGDITFTANVTPVGVYNYAWTIDGTVYNSNNASITLSNMAVGTHTAVVTVSSNGSSAACSATATATAVVVADPVVTISSDITNLCAGGTVVLSVDQINVDPAVAASSYTYEWRENGVLVPNVIGSTFTQTINTPGVHTYAVRVVANNGLGCASAWSNEVQITVVEQPVVTISPLNVALLDICVGGQIEMVANVTNASAAQGTYTYTWYANTANTGVTTANYTQTLNEVGAYNYYVVVNASGNSCAPATSNTLTFNVNPDPYWTNVNVLYSEICEGESVELQASVSGGVTDNAGNTVGTIVWNVTDPANNEFTLNGATNSQSVYHTPATAGIYMYQPTFVGTIGNGCNIDVNPVHPVEVFERPTASFTSGDGVVVCANDPNSFGELVVTINSNYPPFTFTVVGTDGSNNTYHTYNNTYSIFVTPATSVTYSITFLEDANCQANNLSSEATVITSQIELVDDIVATCNDAEQPMATMGVIIYSAAPGVVPTVNVIYNDPNYSAYNSYNVPIDADGTNSTFTFATPTEPGDYSITIEIDGCEYDAIVRVLASQYSYGETPIINQRWDDVLVVNNNPATNGGHTYVSYQWYKNGQPIEGATGQFYQEIGGVNGYYSVNLVVRDENGNIYEITTCEELFVAESLMKVYPVPAQLNEAITIEVNLTDEQLSGAVLDIYDAKGAVVRQLDVNSNVIVLSGFETQGSYFGRIITGTGEIKTVKFVIVK